MRFSLNAVRQLRKEYQNRGHEFLAVTQGLASLGVETFDLTIENGMEQYHGPDGQILVSGETTEKVAVNTKTNGMGIEFIIRDYREGKISLLEFRQKLGLLGVEWLRMDLRTGIIEYHGGNNGGELLYSHKVEQVP